MESLYIWKRCRFQRITPTTPLSLGDGVNYFRRSWEKSFLSKLQRKTSEQITYLRGKKFVGGGGENDFLRKDKTLILDFTHLPDPDEDSLWESRDWRLTAGTECRDRRRTSGSGGVVKLVTAPPPSTNSSRSLIYVHLKAE